MRQNNSRNCLNESCMGLFKKVTNLDVMDFELLFTMGLFNYNLMNQSIFQFKRYEDASLTYTGIDRHNDDEIGSWDISTHKEEFERLFYNQQNSMLRAAAGVPTESAKLAEKIPVTVGAKTSLITEQYCFS